MRLPRGLVVRYRHRGVGEADVLLSSFPRSGNTWLRFMLSEALTGRSADFDQIRKVIPDVGHHLDAAVLLPTGGRVIKTHELYRPTGPRAIYLVRDVRAVVPSMYKMARRGGYSKDIDAFLDDFLAGRAGWFGTWVEHVHFWLGPGPSVDRGDLVVRFEDLREDPVGVLRTVIQFLGVNASEPKVLSAVSHNDLRSMQEKERSAAEGVILNRRSDLPFVGSGSAEGWRSELNSEQTAILEEAAVEVLERLGYPTSVVR